MTDSPDPRDSPGPVVNGELPGPTGAGRRSRPVIAFLATGLVLVLGAGSLTGLRLFGVWDPGSGSTAGPAATPGPTATAAESPFAGTPAADFAEGAAGIVLPEAEPVGDFTAEQVADALAQVRRALIATRLDPTMLVHHNPEHLLRLLAPDQRSPLREAFDSETFTAFFNTRVAKDAELASPDPRVSGRISYQATTAEGDLPVLEVATSFVWAYGFEAAGPSAAGNLVVVRDKLVWQVRRGRPWAESSHGLWLADARSGAWGRDCGAYQQGLLRPDDTSPLDRKLAVAFDHVAPLERSGNC